MPALTMSETPQVPPGVSGQMGAGGDDVPFSGVGAQMAKQKPPAGPAGGGADPSGALKNAVDTITRVIDNMATTSKVGGPYAARIKELLNAWVAEDAKNGKAGAGPGGGSPEPFSARPTEGHGSSDFVG